MIASNKAPIFVIGETPATFILEDYLKNFFFFNSPMDARLEIQHTKIYDLFSPDYKKESQMLHELLCAYCIENIDNIRALESIIKKDIVVLSDDSYAIDYHSIFLNLDDRGELAFFEGFLPLSTFVSRYRLLCAVDALVGIGNTLWALDNLRKFKIFLNKISFLGSETNIEEIVRKFSSKFNIIPSTVPAFGDNSGEVSLKGIHKANAIEFLLNHLNISNENTYAYGDGMNDKEMLEFVNIGVAMGNAKEKLKFIADDITDTHDNNGIYNSFKKYALI